MSETLVQRLLRYAGEAEEAGRDLREPEAGSDISRAFKEAALELGNMQGALFVIATYPITDPKNQDAVNLQAIARQALPSPSNKEAATSP